jgi:hypothetical protein
MTNFESLWQELAISDKDFSRIYNHLLETETPASLLDLSKSIVLNEINNQIQKIEADQNTIGKIYYPKEQYEKNDYLIFPHRSWEVGQVLSVREGINPEYSTLKVIDVEFADKSHAAFASNLSDHKLNTPAKKEIDKWLDPELVIDKYGQAISEKIKQLIDSTDDLVCIAGHYFPRALLIDIGIGQLNLCEAILEMENGGPLSTQELLNQIEFPTGVNSQLLEFSLDYALQEDTRFDEVGPAGKTLWFLKRLEPDEVQNTPFFLQYYEDVPVLPAELLKYKSFGTEQCDELESEEVTSSVESVIISLSYPHWRSGTLPLTSKLRGLFPTAYETPRIKFNFSETKNGATFDGWVVRPSKYIFGLRDWFNREGLIPGSLIQLSHGKNPGEVSIKVDKAKNSKDWIKTVLVGTDGGIVFALLKQVSTCTYDERMALVTPDTQSLDAIWEKKSKLPIEKIIRQTMVDLAKLNPQGQIHAQELYAAVNTIRRCPPSVILSVLFSQDWVKHLGDLYF